MAKEIIQENSFDGAAGGAGTLNYQTGYGTPGGGNITQDLSKFSSSDKTVSHMAGADTTGSVVPKMPERQDRVSSSGGAISPAAMADTQKASKPLNPDDSFEPQVNQLFKKKVTPSPDEILQGLQYELGNMVQKDKVIAKQTVLKNLKQDPTYYSRLGMLNIKDKDMKVDEGCYKSTFTKTKNLLDQMVMERKQKIKPVPPTANEIMSGLWERRHGYRPKK
jgi:hypothetical protein